jgi:hypothetical protein
MSPNVQHAGHGFVEQVIYNSMHADYVKEASKVDAFEEAARFEASYKRPFPGMPGYFYYEKHLVGARIRTKPAYEYSAVEIKMTHSNRKHGEPSEFDRLAAGKVEHFVQTYAGRSYVVLDVVAMRKAGMFEGGFDVVTGTSNGGAFAYAEFALRDLAKAGVIVDASADIKAFFGL